MEKIMWTLISDIEILEVNTLIKCVGVVAEVNKGLKFVSFVVSDMTGTIEATIYDHQKAYECLQLPQIGDSVVLLGYTHKKQTSSETQFIKLLLKRFRIIDTLQEFTILEQVLDQSKNYRKQLMAHLPRAPKTKRPLLKQLQFAIEPLDIRTLILSCVYITLQNNVDLESYIFSARTIQKHRLTKSFLEAKKIKEEAIEYLGGFIEQGLDYLASNHFIEKKEETQQVRQFKITRKRFIDIELRMIGMINSRKDENGIKSGELVVLLNREFGFLNEKNFILNDNLVQRFLKKFIEEGKIYKSSDKALYPNV